MTHVRSLLERICDAQTRNSTLSGEELREVGRSLAALARPTGRALLAVDEAGERVIGAALMLDDNVETVDTSRRLDGFAVLLVAGHVAGTTAIAMKATLARSSGAKSVEAAVIGGAVSTVAGCESVYLLATPRHLVAL